MTTSTTVDKAWYTSKTIWLNILTGIAALLAIPEFVAAIPNGWMTYVLAFNALANVALRLITSQSIRGIGDVEVVVKE